MKKIMLFIVCMFSFTAIFAQPEKFNYQGVARGSNGNALANQALGLRISILDGSATGASQYVETHAVTTNAYGLYNIAIGGGTVVSGSMSAVSWSAGDKYIKVEMDPAGGSSYTTLGTTQLLSVPYALYAANPGPQGPAGPQGPMGPQGIAGSANISGTPNYMIRFGSANSGGNSNMIDSSLGLYYNRTAFIPNVRWAFKSKPNAAALANWFLAEGDQQGYTFVGAMDSTSMNKGFFMGRTQNCLNSATNDSVGLYYYSPATNTVSLSNNSTDLFSVKLKGGRMGYNNTSNAHFGIISPYDTAAYFASSSSNYIADGILQVRYTGTALYDHIGVFSSVVPNAAQDYGIGVLGVGGYRGSEGDAISTTTSNVYGMLGFAVSNGNNYGVYASATNNTATGGTKYGVYGTASGGTTNYAGYFLGNVQVTGSIAKGSGTFKIDHPLDPEHKYLYHSFIESSDMMNVYNGNVITDANGEAEVILPDYFEALNKDFRYQLTVIGSFAQAMISDEVSNNKFKVKTNAPNVKVSWQVTGIRQDKFANAHRVVPEMDKEPENHGKYLHAAEWGQPLEKSIDYINTQTKPGGKQAASGELRRPQQLPRNDKPIMSR